MLNTTPDRLLIGRLPEDMPFDQAILGDTRVAGSWGRGATGNTVVLAVPHDLEAAQDTLHERLLASGFDSWPSLSGAFGFTAEPHIRSISACSERALLHSTAYPGEGRGRGYLVVTWTRLDGMGRCGVPDTAGLLDKTPIPLLDPPNGVLVHVTGASYDGFRRSYDNDALLVTGRPIAEMMDHYAAQLQRRGAVLNGQQTSDFAIIRHFAFRDDEGTTWDGELVMTQGLRGSTPVIHSTIRMWNAGR
jgi:hypothetical protein